VLTSHARPDGDAIDRSWPSPSRSTLGKYVRLVDHDPAPLPYRVFPGVDRIEVAPQLTGERMR
jgi:hypothetical protein